MALSITLQGEGYEQRVTVSLGNKVLYSGWADDLVSFESNGISLVLNFGDRHAIKIAAYLRRVGDQMILIPDMRVDQLPAAYATIVLPYLSLVELWVALRYDPQELASVPPLTARDALTLWRFGSRLLEPVGDTWEHALRKDLLCLFPDDPSYLDAFWSLVDGRWEWVQLDRITRLEEAWQPIQACLEQSDWNVFRISPTGDVFVDLGGDWGLPVTHGVEPND